MDAWPVRCTDSDAMKIQASNRAVHLPLICSLFLLGCGPVEVGNGGDRSIQVVFEKPGYEPFG